MEKTLDTFTVGESGVVKAVLGEGKIKRRLFDMGITPGAEVYMRKKAPLYRAALFYFPGINPKNRSRCPPNT